MVPAAGVGKRMGSAIPKQYVPLLGRPVIAHTLATLLHHPRIDGVRGAWYHHGHVDALTGRPRLDGRALRLGPEVLLIGRHPQVGYRAEGVAVGGPGASGAGCHGPNVTHGNPRVKGKRCHTNGRPESRHPWRTIPPGFLVRW